MESSNRNFYIIGLLVLLLIGLFMIPVSGLLLDPAPTPNYLDTPMEELNNYSLRQVYGESLYLNEDIQQLNNNTLREVFEGGNKIINPYFLDGYTSWSFFGINSDATDIVVKANKLSLVFLANTQYGRLFQSITVPINSVVYYSSYINTVVSTTGNVNFTRNNLLNEIPSLNYDSSKNDEWQRLSGISNTQDATTTIQIVFYDNRGSGWTHIYVTEIKAIDLTSLDIEYLTVEQMDFWSELYEDIKVSNLRSNAIEYGIYSRDTFVQNMNRFGLENTSLAKLNYYYDLYQYYISFELD